MGVLVDYVRKNYLTQNRNCVMVISGATGTGKSWTGLRVGASLDPTFNYKSLPDRLCFSQEEFIQRLNATDSDGNFLLQPGMVLMYEEGGVSVDARSWWMNKDLSHIFETFRNRNLIVIFTMPLMKMLDSNVRALTNFSIHTEKVYKTDGLVKVIVKELLINKNIKASDSYITRYIKFKGHKYKQLFFLKPPTKLRHRYEKIANKWKYELVVKKEDMINEKREGKKVKTIDYDKLFVNFKKEIDCYDEEGKLKGKGYIRARARAKGYSGRQADNMIYLLPKNKELVYG